MTHADHFRLGRGDEKKKKNQQLIDLKTKVTCRDEPDDKIKVYRLS